MKKKTKYMIVGLVGLGLVVFGLIKGVPAYEKHVLTEYLEAEISQSAGIAIECYNTYIASEDALKKSLTKENTSAVMMISKRYHMHI